MGGLTAGLRGRLEISFRDLDDHTTAASMASTPPLELRGPFKRDRGADLYLLRNTTAGILAGDDHDLRVTAEAGTNVRVASTAASKALTMPGDGARVRTTLTARAGSSLVWGPHATVLQTGSRLRQSMRVTLAHGAALVIAEVVVFGRLASGQKYDFAAYESDLVIADDRGCVLYEEAYCLSPGADLRSALAEQGAMATVYVLGAAAERFDVACLPDEPLAGCSRLPNAAGVIARALAPSLSRGLAFVDRVLAAGCY